MKLSLSHAIVASLSAAALAASAGVASGQLVRFQRAIGTPNIEVAYDIDRTTDGGYVLAGRTTSPVTGAHDMYIVRTDNVGATTWVRRLNSANNMDDVAYAIRAVDAGGFIVAGETNTFNNLVGLSLTRLSEGGAVAWSRIYNGTPFLEFPDGVSVRDLSSGGFGVVGRVLAAGPNNPSSGVLVVTDNMGNPIIQQIYSFIPAAGGQPSEVSFTDLREIPVSAAGPAGFLISGHLMDQNQQTSALVVRTNAVGAIQWARTYSSPDASTAGVALGMLPNNNAVFSAYIDRPGNPRPDGIIARIDLANGNLIWAERVDGFRPGTAGLEIDEQTSIIVSATTGTPAGPQQAALLKLTPAGAPIFSIAYGPPTATCVGHDLVVLPCDRGYALSGSINNPTPPPPTNGGQDVYFVKADESGRSGCLEIQGPLPVPLNLAVRSPQLIVFAADNNLPYPLVQVDPAAGNILYCRDVGCIADVDDGSATGTPDGGVTIDDLLYYLAIFERGIACADVDDGSGTGTPDGGVTIDDLLFFLDRFERGC